MTAVLFLALSLVAQAQEQQALAIFHRIISHSTHAANLPAWTKRGSWSEAGWHPEEQSLTALPAGDLYQVGYGTSPETITNFVSVPECHLHSVSASPLQDTITLVLPKQLSIQPIHLLYAVKGADVTRCQPGARTPSLNTTIQLEYPQRIDGPKLYEPLVVKYQPDGTVEQPEVEKTFIQKYWLYILPAALLVLTSI